MATLRSHRQFLLSLILLVSVGTARVQADDGTQTGPAGLYLGTSAGVTRFAKSDLAPQFADTTALSANHMSFDMGYNFVEALGFKWDSGLRTEVEFDWRHAGASKLGGTSADGTKRDLGFSGNVLYDFDQLGTIAPYLGGGVGMAENRWSGVSNGVVLGTYDGGHLQLQWQGIAGVGMDVAGLPIRLFVEYRYIRVGSTKIDDVTLGGYVKDAERSNNALIGMRYFF